uniref:Bm11888 n=1 Tax=Brugia malayi TaxID=6279 RepID=A0A1I9GAD6_BRUMA|nr:Bm11888 [Brugia malayi]
MLVLGGQGGVKINYNENGDVTNQNAMSHINAQINFLPPQGRQGLLWLSVCETQSGVVAEEQGRCSHSVSRQEAAKDAAARLTVLRSWIVCGMLLPTSRTVTHPQAHLTRFQIQSGWQDLTITPPSSPVLG